MEANPHDTATLKVEPCDYYFEGPNMVFTRAYHLKRGYCCGSRCRHCPYGFEGVDVEAAPTPAPGKGAVRED